MIKYTFLITHLFAYSHWKKKTCYIVLRYILQLHTFLLMFRYFSPISFFFLFFFFLFNDVKLHEGRI